MFKTKIKCFKALVKLFNTPPRIIINFIMNYINISKKINLSTIIHKKDKYFQFYPYKNIYSNKTI